MKLEIEAYITGCSVFLLIKPESEEAEFGKVTSSVLRWAVSVFHGCLWCLFFVDG
jgi:hypothetical protein